MDNHRRTNPFSRRFLVLLLGMCAVISGTTLAWAPAASAHNLEGCHWPKAVIGSTTIHYTNLEPTTSGYYSVIDNAANRWSLSAAHIVYAKDDINYDVVAYTYNYGNTNYDGLTSYSCVGGVFLKQNVSVHLNTYYTDSYVTDNKISVMVHEFGHAAGLAHSNPPASACNAPPAIMWSDTGRYYNCGLQYPQSDDTSGLNTIY